MEETDGKKCTDGDNDTREVKFHDFCFDDAKIQKITIKEEKKTYNNSFSLFYGCVAVLHKHPCEPRMHRITCRDLLKN